MQKSITLACMILCTFPIFGQTLQVSGKIRNQQQGSIELNIPFSDNYYPENSIFSEIAKDGRFHFSLTNGSSQMAVLRYMGKEQSILVSIDRPLHINIDTADSGNIFRFSGTGEAENELLRQLTPAEGLWFVQDIDLKNHTYGKNPYVHWSLDSIRTVLFPLIKKGNDSCEQVVVRSALPNSVRESVETEIRYYYANELYTLLQGWVLAMTKGKKLTDEDSHNIETGYHKIQTAELSLYGLPGREELDVSQSAKKWVNTYLEIKFTERLDTFFNDPDRVHAKEVYGHAIGMSMEKEHQMMVDSGQSYPILIIIRRNILPPYAEERRLADYIFGGSNNDIQFARMVLNDNLLMEFPNSQYIPRCIAQIASSEKLLTQNSGNANIHIRPDYKKINSIEDLIAPYRGKLVYLDFWGTWCGPCIKEMHYAPGLKQHFKNGDIVYLYLDMDEDKDEKRWKDFIYIHNLEGEHVRMTNERISKIWDGLGPDIQNRNGYPHYCIIDKTGNLVIKNAKRPSTGAELYNQLEEVINNSDSKVSMRSRR